MVWMTIDLMRATATPKGTMSTATILAPQKLARRFNDSMDAVERGEADPIEPYEIVENFVNANYRDGWWAVDHEHHGSCLEAVTAAGVVDEGILFYEDSE